MWKGITGFCKKCIYMSYRRSFMSWDQFMEFHIYYHLHDAESLHFSPGSPVLPLCGRCCLYPASGNHRALWMPGQGLLGRGRGSTWGAGHVLVQLGGPTRCWWPERGSCGSKEAAVLWALPWDYSGDKTGASEPIQQKDGVFCNNTLLCPHTFSFLHVVLSSPASTDLLTCRAV